MMSTLISRALLIAVVVLAPLPFGSVELPWIASWCAALGLALALAPVRDLTSSHVKLLLPPVLLILVFVLTVALQLVPNPSFAAHNPLWDRTQELLGLPVDKRIAVGVFQPIIALGPPVAMFLAFQCGFLASVERRGALIVMQSVALGGAAIAAYAIAMELYGVGDAFWSAAPVRLRPLTGPFVNRNNAATYFGSCALIALTVALAQLERVLSRAGMDPHQVFAGLSQERPMQFVLFMAAFVVCITAVVLTVSRAGILLTFAIVALIVAIFLYRWLGGHRRLPLILGSAAVAGAVLAEIWGGGLAFRLGSEGLVDASRADAYRSTLAMIADHPLFGTGLGTFADAFPQYRSPHLSTRLVWDRAHSTPLELAAEMGLPIAFATGAVWLFVAFHLWRGALRRRSGGAVPLAALGVGLLGTIHSFVDFPLQIPGYAIVFAAVCGCGLAQSRTGARAAVADRDVDGISSPPLAQRGS